MDRRPIVRRKSSTFSKAIALAFVLLIVSPVTAPFQTVTLRELAGPRPDVRTSFALASTRFLTPLPGDSVVSILPPVDGTEGRLKLQSHAAADAYEALARDATLHHRNLPPAIVRADRSFVVLRV